MGRTSMRMLKKVGISMAAAIILVVLATIIGATGAQAGGRQDYPGNGVYDLTKYSACIVNGSIEAGKPTILDHDFKTNSTEIRLTNNGADTITVYLYDDANTSGDYSTTFELMPNESDVFSMLTAATTYQVGIESDGREYTLAITD